MLRQQIDDSNDEFDHIVKNSQRVLRLTINAKEDIT